MPSGWTYPLPSLHIFRQGLALAGLIVFIFSSSARAQEYSVPWHSISSGGGTSTGEVYSLSGSIGSPDAGPVMTGGDYTLQGGFWSLIAIQREGAPKLTIIAAGPGQAVISWAPNSPGFILQERLNLTLGDWTPSPSTTNNPVTITIPEGIKFYRLVKP